MELNGDHRIPAPRDQVWGALRTPELLRQCLPGCKSVRQARHAVTATVTLPLDGLEKPFTGRVILTGFDGQDGGLLVIEGSYSYKTLRPRTIEVRLSGVDEATTLLSYRAQVRMEADADGPMDSPLILDAVQRLGVDFATRLGAALAPPPSPAVPEAGDAMAPAAAAPPSAAVLPEPAADETGQAENEVAPQIQLIPLDAPAIPLPLDQPAPTVAPSIDTTPSAASPGPSGIAPASTASPPVTVPPGLRPMVWIPILVLALLLLVVLIR